MPRIIKKSIRSEEAFCRKLKSIKLRVTPQRLAVHRVMMKLVHASADMVLESLKDEDGITAASIYNILSDFADKGIYGRRFSPDRKMYFDVDPGKHAHLYDARNNVFLDFEDGDLIPLVESGLKGKRFRGYKMDNIELQIICHPTRKKKI